MEKDKSFVFHETFPPQLLYLSKLIELASQDYEGTKNEISDVTGIPTGQATGKVVPHIKYLNYMGLIDFELNSGKYKLNLTKLGKVVFDEDRYLMEKLTLSLIHYNITHQTIGAPQWSFLFRNYSYVYNENIDLSSIEDKGKMFYGKSIEIGPLKSMYTKGDFKVLDVIDIEGKNIIFNEKNYNMDSILLYAYTLLSDWESFISDRREVTITEILDVLKWNKGFAFSYETTLAVLDEISARGYITINKQLNPITIIKNAESDEVIDLIYSELI